MPLNVQHLAPDRSGVQAPTYIVSRARAASNLHLTSEEGSQDCDQSRDIEQAMCCPAGAQHARDQEMSAMTAAQHGQQSTEPCTILNGQCQWTQALRQHANVRGQNPWQQLGMGPNSIHPGAKQPSGNRTATSCSTADSQQDAARRPQGLDKSPSCPGSADECEIESKEDWVSTWLQSACVLTDEDRAFYGCTTARDSSSSQ